jgi:protein SCO1/2
MRKSLMRLISRFAAGAVVLISVCGAGCDRSQPAAANQKEFTVRGVIRGIAPDRQTLEIQHEAIPGYMPTMTMPFVVKDPAAAAQLKVGDGVSFRLLADDKEAWIDRITQIPAREVEVPMPSPEARADAPKIARLRDGDPLPAFRLTNENGEPINAETFRGQPFVVTFIFTRCPIPNFCPLMNKNFAQLQEAIRTGGGALAKTRLLSISFDPEFETPAVLKEAAKAEEADPAIWTFATGEKPQIEELTRSFAVSVQPESGTLSHSLATALIDGDGRLVEIWRGNGWKPEEVVSRIETL